MVQCSKPDDAGPGRLAKDRDGLIDKQNGSAPRRQASGNNGGDGDGEGKEW